MLPPPQYFRFVAAYGLSGPTMRLTPDGDGLFYRNRASRLRLRFGGASDKNAKDRPYHKQTNGIEQGFHNRPLLMAS